MKATLPVVLLAAALTGCGPPEPDRPSMVAAPQMAREVTRAASGAYPLDSCVVCGEKLDSRSSRFAFIHEGTEVQLCRPDCRKDFDADPEKYLAKIREARGGK